MLKIEKLDIFGKSYHFNIKGSETVKTKVGGVISFLFYMTLLWFII